MKTLLWHLRMVVIAITTLLVTTVQETSAASAENTADICVISSELVVSVSEQAGQYVDTMATFSKESISSAITSITQNPCFKAITQSLNNGYSLLYMRIARIIIAHQIDITSVRQFLNSNPLLLEKLLPLGCTLLNDFLNKVLKDDFLGKTLKANNASQTIQESLASEQLQKHLQVLARYGQEQKLVLEAQPQSHDSCDPDYTQKQAQIDLFLANLEYDFLKQFISGAIATTKSLQTITANIDLEALVDMFDETVRTVLIHHLTLTDLQALANFAKTKTVAELKKPAIFALIYDAIVKSLRENGYDKELAKFLPAKAHAMFFTAATK